MKVKTKSKKVNKAWLNDHVNDPYVKLAQKEGYRARAAYKLKEIDETFGLIRPGHLVVDLGSAPGAWSQYVRRKLAPAGAASTMVPIAIRWRRATSKCRWCRPSRAPRSTSTSDPSAVASRVTPASARRTSQLPARCT